jgi:uncharacterized protein
MKIDQNRIVLTGAGSGIGRALLQQLAGYPAQVLAVDIDADTLSTAINNQVSPRAAITTYVCDLAQPDNVDGVFEAAFKLMGGIDLFIANAGFAYYERLETPDWTHLARIFQLNVFSTIYAAEKMRALNVNRPFKVVITASAMAYLALPGYAIYGAAKAALHHFAEGYRFELADPSALTLVYPIATRTNFFNFAGSNVPLPWPNQPPEVVAQAIIHGIERDRASIYPSRLFQIYLALRSLLPFLSRLIQAPAKRDFERWQVSQPGHADRVFTTGHFLK